MCFFPLQGWRSKTVNPSGKRSIVFREEDGIGLPTEVPCRKCLKCHLSYSRNWAVRGLHELRQHGDIGCFITLTFNDESLPPDNSLDAQWFSNWIKRLRRGIKTKIKLMYCGEYGGLNGRPHYHMIIFGYDFPDKFLVGQSTKNTKIKLSMPVYESPLLKKIWSDKKTNQSYGFHQIGSASFDSMAYVARYITKKKNGTSEAAEDHYTFFDEQGNAYLLKKEFFYTSNRPGIGKTWLKENFNQVFPRNTVWINGREIQAPVAYRKDLEKINPDMYTLIQERLKKQAKTNPDNTPERRETIEKCLRKRVKDQLKRS